MTDQETKPQVFISYARKDIKFARRLAADLEEAGFDVWWDISDLKGGDDWVRFIPAAIQTSQYFVVLLSPDSVQSEWVAKEYSYALRLRKKIVPAMIKFCEVPFALNTINYVDFINEEYATAVNKLLVALDGVPLPIAPVTGLKRLTGKLPPVFTRNPFLSIGVAIVILAILLYPLLKPTTPIPVPSTNTLTITLTDPPLRPSLVLTRPAIPLRLHSHPRRHLPQPSQQLPASRRQELRSRPILCSPPFVSSQHNSMCKLYGYALVRPTAWARPAGSCRMHLQ